MFVLRRNDATFDQTNIIFALDSISAFALLQSSVHQVWALRQGASLESRPRYTPTDCFETFPFPPESPASLLALGTEYHAKRQRFLLSERKGLTDFYNLFHDPDCSALRITEVRELHRQIDEQVLAAYCWADILPSHDFQTLPHLPENDRIRYTICEDARLAILRRLSQLNRQRWQREQEEEQRLAAEQSGSRQKRRAKLSLSVINGRLF